ncbi:hypothetical protein [Streptodolium elevatio]
MDDTRGHVAPFMLTMARSRPRRDKSAPRPARRDIGLAYTARVLGLGADAPDAYRTGYPGSSDGRLYTAMNSDSLFPMPSTWLAEGHAAADPGVRIWDREPSVVADPLAPSRLIWQRSSGL